MNMQPPPLSTPPPASAGNPMPHGSSVSLSGTVAAVEVHKPDSGWCVLRVTAEGHKRQVKVVGVTPRAQPGEYIEATGTWDEYGGQPQFRAKELRLLSPRTTDGVVRLLGSGIVKGVGKSFAKKLGAHFGESLPEVIRDKPHLLEKVDGIGHGRRKLIEIAWAAIEQERNALLFLASHGIGGALATRLCRLYGDRTAEVVRREPYRLFAEVDGVGFLTADGIAQSVGIPTDSPIRLRAGVLYAMQLLTQNGDCAAERAALIETTVKEITVPVDLVVEAIDGCVRDGTLDLETDAQGVLYFLPRLKQAEERVAHHITRIAMAPPRPWPVSDIEAAITWVQARESITFSASQANAMRTILASPHRCAIVTGGPGTGKSTILRSVLSILEAKKQEARLAAPTGRAARRMNEATGRDASTVHRLLGYDGHTRRFTHKASYPLATDLVALDECSMLGVTLTSRVLEAVSTGTGLLLLGDADQLPSIEPGSVLSDLIRSDVSLDNRV